MNSNQDNNDDLTTHTLLYSRTSDFYPLLFVLNFWRKTSLDCSYNFVPKLHEVREMFQKVSFSRCKLIHGGRQNSFLQPHHNKTCHERVRSLLCSYSLPSMSHCDIFFANPPLRRKVTGLLNSGFTSHLT